MRILAILMIITISISIVGVDVALADVREMRIEVAVLRAKAFSEYRWSPMADVEGWRGGYTLHPGGSYTVPYSQCYSGEGRYVGISVGLDWFDGVAKDCDSRLYSPYINASSIKMPVYGTDCSGYVSYILGIDRLTTIGFDDMAREGGDFYYAKYSGLRSGDLLNTRGSHVIFVAKVEGDLVTTYEQTPNGGIDTVVRVRAKDYFVSEGYRVIRYRYPTDIPMPDGVDGAAVESSISGTDTSLEQNMPDGSPIDDPSTKIPSDVTDIPDKDIVLESNAPDTLPDEESPRVSAEDVEVGIARELLMTSVGVIVGIVLLMKRL